MHFVSCDQMTIIVVIGDDTSIIDVIMILFNATMYIAYRYDN